MPELNLQSEFQAISNYLLDSLTDEARERVRYLSLKKSDLDRIKDAQCAYPYVEPYPNQPGGHWYWTTHLEPGYLYALSKGGQADDIIARVPLSKLLGGDGPQAYVALPHHMPTPTPALVALPWHPYDCENLKDSKYEVHRADMTAAKQEERALWIRQQLEARTPKRTDFFGHEGDE